MKQFLLLFILVCTQIKAQNGFTTYSCTLTNSPLSFSKKSAIAVDQNNNKWIGFKNTGSIRLLKFDGTVWTDYSSSVPYPIMALTVDPSNNLWIGMQNGGLLKYDGTSFTNYNTGNSNLVSDTIITLSCINNKIYAGSYSGFSEFNGTAFTNYTSQNSGLNTDTVSCFEKEGSQIWIGTGHGLHKLNSGVINYIGNTDYIHDIMIDATGNKWIGTDTSGLLKYDNTSFINFNTMVPEVFGCQVPKIIKSIGTSINGNPVISGNKPYSVISTTTLAFNLIEIYSDFNYQYIPLPIYLRGPLLFCNDIAGKLLYIDGTITTTSWQNKNFPTLFDQNQYSPSSAISNIIPENTQYLDINNVKAGCNPSSGIHTDGARSLYEVPKGSSKKTTIGTNFWIGGYVNNQLRIAANTYRQNGVDFWPGYIDSNTGLTDTAIAMQFNKVWKINRFDVENFKFNFNAGNVQNGTYPIPSDILSWPGNTNNPNEELAPFFDYNNDLHYNPYDGDYPLIRGDQMLWWVFNDKLSTHLETGSVAPLGVQIQASAYAYTCPNIHDSDKVINYTTFYNYKIINKSSDIIDSVMVGFMSDVDLGFYNDDYVGCDVQNNFGFVYNGDNYEEGPMGYGTNLPYFSYNVLQGPIADFSDSRDNDNDGCIDCTFPKDSSGNPIISGTPINESVLPEHFGMSTFLYYNNDGNAKTGNPDSVGSGKKYYRYLNSTWKDGTPVRYDTGNGTSATGLPCNYQFPGSSDPYGFGVGGSIMNPMPQPPWSEDNSIVNNQPADRRFVSSSGRFTLQPGGSKEMNIAYVFTQDSIALTNGTLYEKVVSDNKKVRNWFLNNNAPSCLDLSGLGIKKNNEDIFVNLFPNPANGYLNIETDNQNFIEKINVYDLLGKQIMNLSASSSKLQINLGSLANGVYLISIQSSKGEVFKKFIKE